MFRQAVNDVVELGRREGVPLGDDDVVEQQVALAAGLAPDSYSSLHHDLSTGRRMELDALHGSVVRRADRLGLPVPANRRFSPSSTRGRVGPAADRLSVLAPMLRM